MDSRHEVKSLKKALKVLTFMNQRGDTSVSEVALAIGVPRPTSYRILETLASEGYVEKQRHSVFYRITSRVQGLAAGFQDEERLLEVAKPLIEASGAALGWPISLFTPRDTQMVARINTDYDCALALERFNIGFAAPMLHATSGYCYLAHLPPQEREQTVMRLLANDTLPANYPQPGEGRYLSVDGNVTHLTRFNRSRYDEICLLLRLVQERGFCNIEFTEYREGNLSVPLVIGGRAVGGIVMRYIKSVMKNTDRIQTYFVPQVQQLAANITAAYLAPSGQSTRPTAPKAEAREINARPRKPTAVRATKKSTRDGDLSAELPRSQAVG